MENVANATRGEPHSNTDWRAGVWAGLIAGLVFVMLEMAFPWFEIGRSWIGAFSHLMFGVIIGLAYATLRKPITLYAGPNIN